MPIDAPSSGSSHSSDMTSSLSSPPPPKMTDSKTSGESLSSSAATKLPILPPIHELTGPLPPMLAMPQPSLPPMLPLPLPHTSYKDRRESLAAEEAASSLHRLASAMLPTSSPALWMHSQPDITPYTPQVHPMSEMTPHPVMSGEPHVFRVGLADQQLHSLKRKSAEMDPAAPVSLDFKIDQKIPSNQFSTLNPDSFRKTSPNGVPDSSKTGHESGSDSDEGAKKRRGNLPKGATYVLKNWLSNHVSYPYPTDEEKHILMVQTSLTLGQINNWFINARRFV
eukprot:TRINITY_DN6045_c0_g1_i1.p1 TRINITY_DN6045_c0_g1~~TRINITY_DN6045_c0_g1_i1.p1  ORF type:complete len:281 (-),score=51.75 TRINITY_DN6045_c0_g1_i1:307-1149(-)